MFPADEIANAVEGLVERKVVVLEREPVLLERIPPE
jgi:hypothetical protein